MKIDTFTKIVLTIIAVNLSISTLSDISIFPKAHASEPVNHFDLAPNTNFGMIPVNADGSINVKISEVIDVNLEEINGYSNAFYAGTDGAKLLVPVCMPREDDKFNKK